MWTVRDASGRWTRCGKCWVHRARPSVLQVEVAELIDQDLASFGRDSKMRSDKNCKTVAFLCAVLALATPAFTQPGGRQVHRQISVQWPGGHPEGQVLVSEGVLAQVRMAGETGSVRPAGP